MIGADSNGHVGEGNRGDENVMGMWWKAYPRGESGDRGQTPMVMLEKGTEVMRT